MDRQLKQRLVGASVVVALAVIIVPELVKQQPTPGEAVTANVISEIPPRPVISEQAVQSAGQSAVIILPGGQAAQQPETIGSDNAALPDEAADLAEPSQIAEPAEIVMPPISGAEEDRSESAGSRASDGPDPAIQTAKAISDEPAQSAAPKPEATAQKPAVQMQTRPEPQRLQPEKPIVAAQRAEPRPAAPSNPPPPRSASASRSAAPASSESSSPSSNQEIELPAIQLIARSQYAASTTRTQQVSQQPRWMVQAGSFYVAENASMLREKLRQQRFPASLQSAVVEGRTVYRVQVGPHATRSEGERTQQRLLREAGINGSIVPVYN